MDGSALFEALKKTYPQGSQEEATTNKEFIHFNGTIESFPVKRSDVTIMSDSTGDHEMASTRLKLTSMVNFSWPHEYMHGQMVAVHKENSYLAYAIIPPGKKEGAIRVVQQKTEERILLKGMKGRVKDLAFAHTTNEIILGCVDEFGNLFIFEITEASNILSNQLILQINGKNLKTPSSKDCFRLAWCPYIPEEDDDTDSESVSKLVALTHNEVAQLWNVDIIMEKYGSGPHDPDTLKEGKLILADHKDAITDASFSPDGTALATSSLDGMVKFFQVYMPDNGETPRCLHKWAPHNGEPVSSLFFLDDHKCQSPNAQIWKYVVTGSNYNSELKIWSCETWTCLQKIDFKPSDGKQPILKCALDMSAKFLLLSDIHRKIIYVLQIQENESSNEQEKMQVVSVSEFATPFPFLCMSIYDAGIRKIAMGQNTLNEIEIDPDDTFEDDDILEDEDDIRPKWTREATLVELVLVQPKSLETCKIIFDDASKSLTAMTSGLKLEHVAKEEIIMKKEKMPVPNIMDKLNGSQLKDAADKITLLSPDVFSQPTPSSSNAAPPPLDMKEEVGDEILLGPDQIKQERQSFVRSEGNSPPSREVQDILGDSEEQDLGADVVITEEPYDEEDGLILDEDMLEIKDNESKPDLIKDKNINTNLSDPLGSVHAKSPFQALNQGSVSHSRSMDWPGVPNINREPVMSTYTNSSRQHTASDISDVCLDTLIQKVNEVTNLMKAQKTEIQELGSEIRGLKHNEKTTLENMAKRNGQQVAEALKRDSKTRNDALLAGLSQAVSNTVSQKIESILRSEVKKLAPQIINQTLVGVTAVLEQDVKIKVSKADQMLKEALNKLVNSRQVSDSLAHAISSNVQTVMQGSLKDVTTNALIPGFERALQAMLVQVSQNLHKGVKEHENLLTSHMDKIRTEQMVKFTHEIRNKLENVTIPQHIVTSVCEVVKDELQHGLRSVSATPSAEQSLSNSGSKFEESIGVIRIQLSQGKFDDAFTTALMARDLQTLEATCEMVNCTAVFNQDPYPLNQGTLLTLIQQLGTNLENKTELKHDYIKEAVMALNLENDIIREHKNVILSGLRSQLDTYIKQHPNQKITKQFKILDMATNSVINS